MNCRTYLIQLLVMLLPFWASSQMSQEARDSINRLSSQDHALMMKSLGLTTMRPGPSGNPNDPNAANADESKAKTYDQLPDPLKFKNGQHIKIANEWSARKLEIIEDFDREIYGRLPDNIPNVKWQVVSSVDTILYDIPVKVQELMGKVDNSSHLSIDVNISMTLTVPQNAKAVPVVLEFGWIWPAHFKRPEIPRPTWQEQLLIKNWGYAILIPTSFQADNGAGLREGIIGLCNQGEPRKLDDWGALRAWAWGASRAMDYFENISEVDARRVVIEGLSRYGKAALVTMAYDERFAIGLIGSSGAGGAKLLRRNFGEQVENLASSGEYHWFTPNFIKYASTLTANDLPVDAHELLAVCAPRPIFISTGAPEVEGNWVDAKGMFMAGVAAGPVYELLGKKSLGTHIYPPTQAALIDGDIAFRQHEGGHTVGPNWPTFIIFASRYFTN